MALRATLNSLNASIWLGTPGGKLDAAGRVDAHQLARPVVWRMSIKGECFAAGARPEGRRPRPGWETSGGAWPGESCIGYQGLSER